MLLGLLAVLLLLTVSQILSVLLCALLLILLVEESGLSIPAPSSRGLLALAPVLLLALTCWPLLVPISSLLLALSGLEPALVPADLRELLLRVRRVLRSGLWLGEPSAPFVRGRFAERLARPDV